ARLFKDFTQNVENAPLQSRALDFELHQQSVINVAFACLLRDEIPKVTNLGLTDAVDSTKPLFEPVRIPRQIVIDHEVGVLEVHAFASSVGGYQHAHVRVRSKERLQSTPLVAMSAAVDCNDTVAITKYARDLAMQVIQRVAVLGKN